MAKIYRKYHANHFLCFFTKILYILFFLLGCFCFLLLAMKEKRNLFWIIGLCSFYAAFLCYRKSKILKSGLLGERITRRVLAKLPKSYVVFCNLKMIVNGRVAEFDHTVIGPTGIFIIEVKHHAGHIKGDVQKQDWLQVRKLPKGKMLRKTFANPIWQNQRQVDILKTRLRQEGLFYPVQGYVYFSNEFVQTDIEGARVFTNAHWLCEAILKYPQHLNHTEIKKLATFMRSEYDIKSL